MKSLILASLALTLASPAAARDEVTSISQLERGTIVTVQGSVERILDEDEFRLRDETGAVRVYTGPNMVPVDPGETVTVQGWVDDGIGPLELYARSLTRADGTQVTFDRRYE
ncbi:MAG: NirD/YgiW/YdeI family stress tolerance protein [Caulobacterales bacterium]|uniref:NirD/YgiW/YdeI family stress tolerance protein n=1 Tax=Glycocaulis sp. TaxID=1969725 RepID=UPI003FA0D337